MKNSRVNFILYNICIITIPYIILIITAIISPSDYDFSDKHILDDEQAIDVLSTLILMFGIHLYPLHIIFLNKSIMDIEPKKFIKITSISISVFPISLTLLTPTLIPFMIIYDIIFLLTPFFIIHSAKRNYYKRKQNNSH